MTLRARLALGLLAAALVVGALVTRSRAPEVRPAHAPAESEPAAAGPAALVEIAAADAPLDRRTIAAESASIEPAESAAIESAERVDEPCGTLRVQVRWRDSGEPVADVRLVLLQTDGNGASTHVAGSRARVGESPVTGADGLAELEVAPGQRYLLRARPHGFSYQAVRDLRMKALEPGETRAVAFELPALDDLPLVGRVVASETGQPVAGARVSFDVGIGGQLTAGADGYFETRIPSAAVHYAMAEAPGFARRIAADVRGHGSRAEALVIRLHRSAQLNALVLAADGTPVEGVQVSLSADPNDVNQSSTPGERVRAGNLQWGGRTGADGRSTVKDLPPFVPLVVECRKEGGMRTGVGDPLYLDPGEVRECVFRIGGGATVAGRIDAGGDDPEGLRIWLARAEAGVRPRYFEEHEARADETVTVRDGWFEFVEVPDGTWLVGPAPGGPHSSLAEVVEVVDGVADRQVYLQRNRGLYIEGRVADPAGAPIAGASVIVTRQGSGASLGDGTDRSGGFSVGPLEPGEYSVYASGAELGHTDSFAVLANAGDADIQLQLQAAGRIRGRLVSVAGGGPVEGLVTASLAGRPRPWSGWHTTPTDEAGGFELGGLVPGLYHVAASTAGGECVLEGGVTVEAGSRAAEILLEARPGATLVVRYAGSQPHGYFRAELGGAVVAADRIASGSLSSRTVPAGRIRVECSEEDFAVSEVHELALAAGEERELVFGRTE